MTTFLWRTLIDVALGLHFAVAVGYWWFSPQGFPVGSCRFWLNSVLPVIVAAMALAGLAGIHKSKWSVAGLVVLCFASAWCAGAIASRVFFPISLRLDWLIALAISASAFACFGWLTIGGPRSFPTWFLSSILSALVGIFAAWSQVPPSASTEPLNVKAPPQADSEILGSPRSTLQLGASCKFNSTTAELLVSYGDIRIECSPILDFDRKSPDGFWSLLAPQMSERRSPKMQLKRAAGYSIRYSDDAVVEILAPSEDQQLRLAAFSTIYQDTFSHLNTYCHFNIFGHKRLTLTFSPCENNEIDVLPSDYPVGRPARFAYVDDSSSFHIVEATSGEKGPFHLLADGKLARGDPLTITFRDDGRPIASVTLDDWSRQVSAGLSPTAGWRVPVNSIEFQRVGDGLTSPVEIWISLAATSVGRGWDTVGHHAGTYRNSLEFRTIDAKK